MKSIKIFFVFLFIFTFIFFFKQGILAKDCCPSYFQASSKPENTNPSICQIPLVPTDNGNGCQISKYIDLGMYADCQLENLSIFEDQCDNSTEYCEGNICKPKNSSTNNCGIKEGSDCCPAAPFCKSSDLVCNTSSGGNSSGGYGKCIKNSKKEQCEAKGMIYDPTTEKCLSKDIIQSCDKNNRCPNVLEAVTNIDSDGKPTCDCRQAIDPMKIYVQNCSNSYGAGIKTALGCLPYEPRGFINWLLTFAVGIGGGIAFLLIVMGGISLITSTGNPENINKAKDTIFSAVSGLLFIIFAIFLLKLIGVQILQIPGF
ncbi:DUF308 domain-containing protein [Candidatus Beckwithbacteria bacterium]|nr:DUF308 domain-containing protein [Candidatus Beckwithbacteria bacterium]